MELKKLQTILTKFTKTNLRPVINAGMVKDGSIFVTDLETNIRIDNTGLSDGMKDLSVISLTDKTLDMDVGDFPMLQFDESDNHFKVSLVELKELLDHTSTDETRIYLNGVAFIENELVGCNGHVLKVIETEYKNGFESSILPRTSLKIVLDIAKKAKVKEVIVQVSDSYFTTRIDNVTISGRIITREYPKYKAVIPSKTSKSFDLSELPKLVDIKPLLNPRTHGVIVESKNGNVVLRVKDHDVTFDIGKSVDEFTLGFNFKYLQLVGNNKTLMFNNELSPVVIKNGNSTNVVMPLKL